MEPHREAPQVGDRVPHLGDADVELLVRRRRVLRQEPLCEVEPLGHGHEPLLGPVVEVSLQPPPLVVRDLDEPFPRGEQLLARIGVRQGERDELPEGDEPPLGLSLRQRVDFCGRDDDRSPQPAGDVHGRRGRALVAVRAHARRDLALDLVVAPDPHRLAGLRHPGHGGVHAQVEPKSSG